MIDVDSTICECTDDFGGKYCETVIEGGKQHQPLFISSIKKKVCQRETLNKYHITLNNVNEIIIVYYLLSPCKAQQLI